MRFDEENAYREVLRLSPKLTQDTASLDRFILRLYLSLNPEKPLELNISSLSQRMSSIDGPSEKLYFLSRINRQACDRCETLLPEDENGPLELIIRCVCGHLNPCFG